MRHKDGRQMTLQRGVWKIGVRSWRAATDAVQLRALLASNDEETSSINHDNHPATMRLSQNLILPALCWSARLAAATTAHIYIHDPESQPRHDTPSRSLNPVPARLVLAQRAGVEDYHSADISREEVIDAVNTYGVRTPLFAAQSRPRRAFILVEGESDPAGMIRLSKWSYACN